MCIRDSPRQDSRIALRICAPSNLLYLLLSSWVRVYVCVCVCVVLFLRQPRQEQNQKVHIGLKRKKPELATKTETRLESILFFLSSLFLLSSSSLVSFTFFLSSVVYLSVFPPFRSLFIPISSKSFRARPCLPSLLHDVRFDQFELCLHSFE